MVRPTGLIDPEIEIRPVETQVDDIYKEINLRTKKNERVLITTLTKKMAENLSEYLGDNNIKVRYLHSDINTVERTELIEALRLGIFDVLVGINLLREGLDLPEVSLVAILDADKEGFLRSSRSLIQTIGRAARNIKGKAILYADTITNSMQEAISETNRRRTKQIEYNKKHNIQPKSIKKAINNVLERPTDSDRDNANTSSDINISQFKASDKKSSSIKNLITNIITEIHSNSLTPDNSKKHIKALTKHMQTYAKDLDFESAIACRDTIDKIKKYLFS